MQDNQPTLPGTEEDSNVDFLDGVTPEDFLADVQGDIDETTGEQEVFNEEQTTNTPTDQVTKEESPADTTTPEQPVQESTSIDPSQVYEDKATGNLVTQDGTVVAKAGRERRQYVKDQQSNQQLNTQQQELTRLSGVEQQYRDLNTKYQADNDALAKLNIDRNELFQAAQMHQAFKSDPIATINHLLTEARRLGHNVDGLDSGSQLDMKAINKTIEDKLNPITNQYQAQQQAAQQQQETQQQLQQFVSTHEYADVHGGHIAKLMTDSNMDASAAYWMLRQRVTQAGLDFTKPLEPQTQARLQGQSPSTTQMPSVPGVGDIRSSNASNLQSQSNTQQSSSTSFSDIIKQAMKDANYKA